MFEQHRIDHGLGGLDGVFTGKERAVTGHRIGQQALVGRLLAGLFFQSRGLALVANEFLADAFHAGG